MKEWKPGLIIIDPWNRTAQGDKISDYREALEGVFACMPENPEDRPAVLIVHHLRKKSSDSQKKSGRDLLHELAGSYQIGSAARSVFALEPASTDVTDDRVVLTCCKNNDGLEGEPSAWHRRNGLFSPCEDFDFDEFYEGESKVKGITEAAIIDAVGTAQGLRKAEVVKRIVDSGLCGRSAAYGLFSKFPDLLVEDDNYKIWIKTDE